MATDAEDLPRILAEAMRIDRANALDDDMLDQLACAYADRPKVWAQCKAVLQTYKYVREVEPRVKALVRELANIPSIGGPPKAERSISEIWDKAPISEHVYAPHGYQVSMGRPAIERIEQRMTGDSPYERRVAVSQAPILITRRIGNMQNKTILLEIAFRTHRGWHKTLQDRDTMLSSRKIVDTSKFGLPIASDNALEVVSWLRHFEDQNADHIPLGYASGAMGWQGADDHPTKHGFICGTRQIGGNGRAIELDATEGDMAEAREIREYGNFEHWKEAIHRVAHFSAVRLGIIVALATPLIAVVDGPNGVVEWAGRTSGGKSTILKIAQSCWRSAGYQLSTWNSTSIGLEASAQFLSDLPLFIDDSSTALDGGRSQGLGRVVYQLVGGRARGRATREGGQRVRSRWRTIVLGSGEVPLGELAKAEGASARILSIWSAPFGETTPETGALISDTIHALSENYGFAGPRLVQWLCDNRESWDDLRQLYADTCKTVRETICTPAASRLAEVIALLDVANLVAAKAELLPWDPRSLLEDRDIVNALKNAMNLASASADRAFDAHEYMIGEAQARPKSWIPWGEDPGKDDRDPPGGWLGYRALDEFAFFPSQARKILQQGGFTAEAALRAWKDLGVLRGCEYNRYTSQVRPRVDRSKVRLIRVALSYPGHEIEED